MEIDYQLARRIQDYFNFIDTENNVEFITINATQNNNNMTMDILTNIINNENINLDNRNLLNLFSTILTQANYDFEDVIIGVSNDDFNNLEKIEYNNFIIRELNRSKLTEQELREKYKECYICLEEYKNTDELCILPCHHCYHTECIKKWLTEKNNKCPVCKKEVAEGIIIN